MSDKLMTIATFKTLVEASIARGRLEDEGIGVFLADTAAVGVAWHLTSAIGGIKLQVMEDDAEHAISILEDDDTPLVEDEQLFSDEVDEDADSEIEESGEDEYEAPVDEIVDRALRSAFLGLIFLPLQFYSVWLLLHIARDPESLSSSNRRRFLIAAILNTWIIIIFVFFLLIAHISGGHRI